MVTTAQLKKLDKFSLAEVEDVIETYENLRMAITRDINFYGGIEAYENFIREAFERYGKLFADDEVERKRTEKFFAILEQIKVESGGGKFVTEI